jgi:hypothetical protein
LVLVEHLHGIGWFLAVKSKGVEMKIALRAKVEFHVPLRKHHIEALLFLSERHYDVKCKLAGHNGGGFLCRWKNEIDGWDLYEQAEEYRYVTASFDDLDMCLKIMETPIALFKQKHSDYVVTVTELRKSFFGATGLANSKYTKWRATYDANA